MKLCPGITTNRGASALRLKPVSTGNTGVDIGTILRDIRKEKKLTLQQVSSIAGVHSNTVYRIENSLHDSSFAVVEKVAAALGYEVELMEVKNIDRGKKWR